jgi:hypothetical protein
LAKCLPQTRPKAIGIVPSLCERTQRSAGFDARCFHHGYQQTRVSVLGIATVVYFSQADNKKNTVVRVVDYQDTIKKEVAPEVIPVEEKKIVAAPVVATPKKPIKAKIQAKRNQLVGVEPTIETPDKQTIIVKKQVIKKDTIRK